MYSAARKLRRPRFLFSFLMLVVLWQFYYYLLNRAEYSSLLDRVSVVLDHRERGIKLALSRLVASKLQHDSFRERMSEIDAYNQNGELNSISYKGMENFPPDHNNEILKRVYPGVFQSEDSIADLLLKNATTEEMRERFCWDLFLTPSNKHSYGACEPHVPSIDACRLAHALYRTDPSLSECSQNEATICSFKTKMFSKTSEFTVKCDEQVCERLMNQGKIYKGRLTYAVYTVDPEDGLLKFSRNFTELSELESQLPRIALFTAENKFNFMFVKCFDFRQPQPLVSQLISVPPAMSMSQHTSKLRAKNTINVNIVLLDSISRSHFYRSLPKTVGTLRRLAESSNHEPSEAKVFDFELFQAVHGHTTHNEHALFTGHLLPDFDPEQESPTVKAGILFGHFKRAGYQTMWQEDLCWMANWGLMTDFDAEDWKELRFRLRENYVDSTGLTHSSCEILKSYNIDSPFNGPDGDQICFNGKLQHSYFFQYTADTLKTISKDRKARPLFSFTALNVGHDDIGRRTQSLDNDLAHYVATMATEQNTLTILLADHGNTYTEYTTSILEGRLEMFHPSLFIIVPQKVAALLGKEAMTALKVNQRRLLTMIDLHHSLLPLAGSISRFVKPVGIFTPISLNRTCNDIELKTPNFCVCEGWDSPTTNDSSKIAIVEFAVGELNNMIQTQFLHGANQRKKVHPVLRSCQRLRASWFANVRERISKSDGALITSFDVYFTAGNIVKHQEDVFHIEIKSKDMKIQNSLEMVLVDFDRLTLFGKYRKCADVGVQLRLCICSESKDIIAPIRRLEKIPWKEYTTFLSQNPKASNIGESKCLFLIKRIHSEGQSIAIEVANSCEDDDFSLEISATYENLRLSRKLPFTISIPAGSIKFAFSARVEEDYLNTNLDVTVTIRSPSVH
ncbi:uncharacterized protein [Montipora capricornis]